MPEREQQSQAAAEGPRLSQAAAQERASRVHDKHVSEDLLPALLEELQDGRTRGSEARKIVLEEVNLSKMGLYTLRNFDFTKVVSLNISQNVFEELPLLDLPHLRRLDVSRNKLRNTRKLLLCDKLEELNFSGRIYH